MSSRRFLLFLLAFAFVVAGSQALEGQSNALPLPSKPGAEQKQVEHLQQLEQQLRADQDSLGTTASQYGWGSDEADAALEQLLRDRKEYRRVARSLRSAGTTWPSWSFRQPAGGLNGDSSYWLPLGGGPPCMYLPSLMTGCPCAGWPVMVR